MSAPSDATNINMINSVGSTMPATLSGAGWSVLTTSAASQANAATYANHGLSATAYVNSQTGQLVVAFQGVDTKSALLGASSDLLANGAEKTDMRIQSGDASQAWRA